MIAAVTTPLPVATARETCRILGISRSTLTYWMLTGRLKPTQSLNADGRVVAHLFDRAEVQRLAEARRGAA